HRGLDLAPRRNLDDRVTAHACRKDGPIRVHGQAAQSREEFMASPERQIEFLSNLQRLLAEGSFVSTYKYALLLSLGDLCVELGRDDDTPLRIPTRRIGKKFAEYYWRQCRPYRPMGGSDGACSSRTPANRP